jgi:hypothetical protein
MKNEAQQAIIEAEEHLAAASLNLDLSVFEQLLHPDYLIVQPGGVIENKVETIASLASDTRYWQVAGSDEMEVRVYGDTAVVTAVGQAKGKMATNHLIIRPAFYLYGLRRIGSGVMWPSNLHR